MSYNLSIEHTKSTDITTYNSILEDTTIFHDSSSNEIVELHKWLATWTPDCSINYSTALSKRAIGTNEWISNAAVYKKWKKEGKFLWLQGKAGSGKTILVASIIENLKKSSSLNFLAYHFFDFRDNSEKKRTYQGLLFNLILQLGIQNNKIHSALKSIYTNQHLEFKPTNAKLADSIITITRDLVQRKHQVYIMIDGLDECNDLSIILDFLCKLTKFPMVGIIISSRDHSHQNLKCSTLSLNNHNKVNADIDHFLDNQLQTIYTNPAYQVEMKKLLMQKVDEGFFYIECQLHSLNEYPSSTVALQALAQLPSDLKETYICAIAKCKKNEFYSEDVHRLLQWLLYSFEPLHMDQVTVILDLDFNSPIVDPNPFILGGLHRIVNTTLVTVDAQNIVQFAHASVKEFLLESQNDGQVKELFDINAQLAHNTIAHMCLIYLLQYNSETRFVEGILTMFKYYATQYWAEHSKYNENSATPFQDTLNMTQKFIGNSPRQFMNWKQNYSYMGDKIVIESHIFRDCDPVHVVAFFGLRYSIQWAITRAISTQNNQFPALNTSGEVLGTALQTAAFGGHKELVQLLLRNDADVNINGGYYGTALQAAISGGSKAVSQLLLKHNTDVNAKGGYYGTAIQAAAYTGYQDIVQLLLKYNADPNVQGGYYGTPLQAAAFGGYNEIIELLLAKGAKVNTLGGKYGSALQAAVAENHNDIIQILLKHNATPNSQGGYYGTAIQAAAFWGYKETIQLLIKHNADVNLQGGKYGTALQAAVAVNHKDIIQLLLERGANISTPGGYYGTPLHAAAFLGYKETIELFLQYGVDVNIQGGEYGTALQAAAAQGYKDIITLLLKNGANINAQEGQYGTALQIAENNSQEDIVDLLLEYGANVDGYSN
ncbi:ankyrin repeat-containing domain protein [Lentinula raphanica]|uniref:Ankyrin repeat-containing domain protein n=1 Tax=Lentinula raphanica TaxID=153919 RepID=A0AA38NZH7_9AGAR|nr:ankyrin repeat-containing domain protein [Lentinula raphanica]